MGTVRGHLPRNRKELSLWGRLSFFQLSSVIHFKVLSSLVAVQSACSLVYLEIRCWDTYPVTVNLRSQSLPESLDLWGLVGPVRT